VFLSVSNGVYIYGPASVPPKKAKKEEVTETTTPADPFDPGYQGQRPRTEEPVHQERQG
jgi:hypothetical protein